MGEWNRRQVLFALLAGGPAALARADDPLRREAERGLRRAIEFFRTRVAVQGGYVWRYSEDLSRREGEGQVGPTTAWVQPPGTPSVGMAYLTAYRAARDPYYLEAAREAGLALARGQLVSGGWDYRIEFDPDRRRGYAYRVDGGARGRNSTTLDDDTTQAALRFLIELDRELAGADRRIRETVDYALDSLAKAQYPNGAWPQRYESFPDPARFPVRRASYPETWPRTWPNEDYRSYYTFNDNNVSRLVETFLLAYRTYRRDDCSKAVAKSGDGILLAQMPDPQPAWAQQYNFEMHPAWARRFEPPAISGGESQELLRTLMEVYAATGEARYLEPIPRALEYLRRSRLPDGRLARFYELRTNRPLYFTRDYRLTYSDDDLPTHYAFKVPDRTEAISRQFEALRAAGRPPAPRPPERPRVTDSLVRQVRAVLDALDEQGRWVQEGRLRYHGADDPTRRIIASETFIRNVEILARYLEATAG